MDNPSAFPHVNPGFDNNWDKRAQFDGMSLLDYFAAKAMQGMVHIGPGNPDLAKDSYDIAEAMLAERERRIK